MTKAPVHLPKKVLLVEDDPVSISNIMPFLKNQGMNIGHAKDLSTALYFFNNQFWEVAIIGQEFKELSGLLIAQKYRIHDMLTKKTIPIVMMSIKTTRSSGDELLVQELRDIDYLSKPFQPPQLLTYLARAMKKREIQEKVFDIKAKFDEKLKNTKDFEASMGEVKKEVPNLGEKGLDLMIDVYMENEHFDEALNLVSGMVDRMEKPDLKLLNTQASLFMKTGQLENAKKTFEKANSMAPSNLSRLEQMASVYLEMNMPEEAVEKFREIIKGNPEKPDIKFNMFEKLSSYGFDEQAIKLCKEISSSQEIARHYNNIGVLHAKNHEHKEAINQYLYSLKLLQDKKNRSKILFNLALAYLNSQEKESRQKAKTCLDHCLELDPQFEKAQLLHKKLEAAS